VCHYESPPYFLEDFVGFSRYLEMVVAPTIDAGFGRKLYSFHAVTFTDWTFCPVAFLFCCTIVFLIFLTAVKVIIFIRITCVRIVNHFLKLFFVRLAFCVFFWMIGELVRTSPRRLLFTPDGNDFVNFGGGAISWKFNWPFFLRNLVGCWWMDGCMCEGASL